MQPMKHRVDKMRVASRIPGAQYWKVGMDKCLVWAMHDSRLSYTLVSAGLCKELGLTIIKTQSPGNYQVADGTMHKFAGCL